MSCNQDLLEELAKIQDEIKVALNGLVESIDDCKDMLQSEKDKE